MMFGNALDDIFMTYPCNIPLEDPIIKSKIISNLLNGHFKLNLEEDICGQLFMLYENINNIEENLKSSIEKNLKSGDFTECYEIISIGISSLQLFFQINWTGPSDESKHNPSLQLMRSVYGKHLSESQWLDKLSSELVIDGELISSNFYNLELLLLARAIFCAESLKGIVSCQWWRMRCLAVHQQVLEERSPILYSQLTELMGQLAENEGIKASSALATQLNLEAAAVWLAYSHVEKADQALQAARKILGLDIKLVGALGKRTKFQEKEVAQLTLSVEVNRDDENLVVSSCLNRIEPSHFPKDVRLDDDTRLNKIAFSDSSVGQFPRLTDAEQAAVLGTCIHKQKSQPKDSIQPEELIPYITCLTSQPSVWTIQASALLIRSKLDGEHKRTVERALMQLQSLIDSVNGSEPAALHRLAWAYACHLPPAWQLQALLANTYVSLGMIQTALDVFLSLRLWDEVISCYSLLQLRHKAEEVIRQELEKKKTVKLLCLLGDATDDVDCYRQAWELSGGRSGLAQRHWANYFFTRKQYAESIPHLQESLRLNSLQEGLWFRLGYAALETQDWPVCANAYRRYCSLEPESFEAWNNLAKAYVKSGQKGRAFRALQEAVKCNYENWRVWDNLMAVSTDCAQFDEVIRCYHRILDLNEKHVDVEVLRILTDVVIKELVNTAECPIDKLRKQSLALFGRLTSQVMTNSSVWQLYAQLAASEGPQSRTKVAQCLQKAYWAATQGSWERDQTSCLKVIDLCIDLARAYLQCSTSCASTNEAVQMLSSAKLPLKSVLLKIEKEQTDLITGELPENLIPKHKELVAHFDLILETLQEQQINTG